jgi:hypothetical protein
MGITGSGLRLVLGLVLYCPDQILNRALSSLSVKRYLNALKKSQKSIVIKNASKLIFIDDT